mgnify:CR=1 FL=1
MLFLNDEEAAKVAEIFFNPKNHGVKPPAVGQTATHLAEMAGITVPYDAKVLVYETNDTSHDNPWANEKLTTLLGMFRADTLEEAFNICAKLVYEGGRPDTPPPCMWIPRRKTRSTALRRR